jgi:hypothetical protein
VVCFAGVKPVSGQPPGLSLTVADDGKGRLGKDGARLLPIRIPPTLSGYLNAAVILFGPTLAALIMTAVIEGKARRTQTAQQARAVAGGHPMVPVRPSRRPWCRAA